MATKLEDSGERMVPQYHKASLMYGEHLVRYQAASELVKGKVVLDIACGSGYGSKMLAQQAKHVTGVDLNKPAVAYAKQHYGSSKIEFKEGDAVAIPLEDNSVDAVVSFETIEHIPDHKAFVAEVRRVLKDDGMFIVSTPNDAEFPEGADFHVHEFKLDELQKLLGTFFKNVETYYQSTWLYNALLSNQLITTETSQNFLTINAAPVKPEQAIYFLMVCSNQKIKQLPTPVGAISERWTTKAMLDHNAEMDTYIRGTIKHFEKIIKAKDEEAMELRQQIESLQKRPSAKAARWLKSKSTRAR